MEVRVIKESRDESWRPGLGNLAGDSRGPQTHLGGSRRPPLLCVDMGKPLLLAGKKSSGSLRGFGLGWNTLWLVFYLPPQRVCKRQLQAPQPVGGQKFPDPLAGVFLDTSFQVTESD